MEYSILKNDFTLYEMYGCVLIQTNSETEMTVKPEHLKFATGRRQLQVKVKLLLTHGSLCFAPCTGWASSHGREADVVVGSVLRRCVRHGGVAGARLWLRGWALSLGLPSSTASSTWLPWGEAGTWVGLPSSCMLGRWRGPRWGAHGRKGRGGSRRGGGFAGETRTTWRK